MPNTNVNIFLWKKNRTSFYDNKILKNRNNNEIFIVIVFIIIIIFIILIFLLLLFHFILIIKIVTFASER